MNKILRFCLLMNLLVMIASLQASLSHVMQDAGTSLVFSDDFEDGIYTDKWVTNQSSGAGTPTYTETGGYLQAQITNGATYQYAHFFSQSPLDISYATGKKTEVVMSQSNYAPYAYNRTLLLDTQNPWGKGFCIEHQMYPYGRIKLSLYNNQGMTTLYDSGDMAGFQYEYSFSLVVDPVTGAWSFGWAGGSSGVTTTLASGTLTSSEIATYLSSTMYIGTGIYTGGSTSTTANYNKCFEVAAYQVFDASSVPVFTPAGPFIVGPTQVTITTQMLGDQIYYTTDGSIPTASSSLYTGPVTVDHGTLLRAVSILGGTSSAIAEQTYLVPKTGGGLLNDPGTMVVFSDDFEDGSYTDKWVTYKSSGAGTPMFVEADGALQAQITNGATYQYAYFFSKKNFNVSSASGKKTELAMSLCNISPYGIYNRTFFLNSRNPYVGAGFCIEHQRFPKGRTRLALYKNQTFTYLYDSGDGSGYEYDYSLGLVVDPSTGGWLFGVAYGRGGVSEVLASGTLTALQISTYLSSTMYIGTGIYTSNSTDPVHNLNRTYKVAVHQVLDYTLPAQPSNMEIDVTLPPYNAIADDGLSDRIAIQAAIDALPVSGGTVYLPAGVYDLDGDLLICDRDTMPPGLYDKPVFLRGDTYSGSEGSSGSVLRRTTAGNILRVDLNESNFGYWNYGKLSVSDLTFQGDPNHSNPVTAIRGYRTRITLENLSFEDCYNGVHLDSEGALGADYTDTCTFINLRFHNGFGGDGIRIRGADSTILNGIFMEDCAYANGIYLIASRGLSLTNLSMKTTGTGSTGIHLGWCTGVMISGWNYSGQGSNAFFTVASNGVGIDGFNISGNDLLRFYITTDSVGQKIRNGQIKGVGGYDLNIFGLSRNLEFDNVTLLDASGVARGLLMSAVNTARGKYAGTTSDLNGLPFIQLKGSDTTRTAFEVNADGELSPGAGIQILTGSGSPEGVVTALRGSLYIRSNGGSNTTLYVKESGTGTTGWVAKNSSSSTSMIPGDANNDGMVDVGDLGILAANYGRNLTAEGIPEAERWFLGDFNNDGVVDVGDLGILAANYGTGSESSLDFDTDFEKAFGTTASDAQEDDSASTIGRSACSMMGLPLVAGLLLMGLAAVRLKE